MAEQPLECPGNLALMESMNYGLTESNVDLLNDNLEFGHEELDDFGKVHNGDFLRYNAGDSFSDGSSPSTSNGMIVDAPVVPDNYDKNTKASKLKKKTKKELLLERDAILMNKDDSELSEEELQIKRRAQNRAAQRAFRERKESKMKELEDRLNKSEAVNSALQAELEAIKREHLIVQTENEYLKSKSQPDSSNEQLVPPSAFTFPKNENEFTSQLLVQTHPADTPVMKKEYEVESDGKVLAIGSVWDYLLYRAEEDNLNIDIVEVMAKLKGNERCHGYGPAYPVSLIDKVIKECSH